MLIIAIYSKVTFWLGAAEHVIVSSLKKGRTIIQFSTNKIIGKVIPDQSQASKLNLRSFLECRHCACEHRSKARTDSRNTTPEEAVVTDDDDHVLNIRNNYLEICVSACNKICHF